MALVDLRFRLVVLAACLGALGGCGLAPVAPPAAASLPRTSGQAPTTAGSERASAAQTIAPHGFTDYERAALRVRNLGCGGVSTGSGFAISDHVFVTNRHVVGGAALLQVSTFDGHDVAVSATGAAVIADLALVWTKEPLPSAISLAPTNPTVGARVTAVGYPLGGELTTTQGKVTGYAPDIVGWSSLPMLLNDAPIEHGSSGSPLINDGGQLVGVVYATNGRGGQYAVPVEILRSILADPRGHASEAACYGELPSAASSPTATSCGPTVSVTPTTSCAFGLNVEAAWAAAGGATVSVRVVSPVTQQSYTMDCIDGQPVVCTGGNSAVVFINKKS